MEHQAVREYPSPSQVTTLAQAHKEHDEQQQTKSQQAKQQLQAVVPIRRTGSNDLRIVVEEEDDAPTATFNMPAATTSQRQRKAPRGQPSPTTGGARVRGIADTSKRQWDLNTPWVEMLIHEQQRKLATSAAASATV